MAPTDTPIPADPTAIPSHPTNSSSSQVAPAPTTDPVAALRAEIETTRQHIRGQVDEQARRHGESLVERARDTADVVTMAEALWLLAHIEDELSRFDVAIGHLEEAQGLLRDIGYPELEAQVLLDLGELEVLRGERSQARDVFERARIVARSAGLVRLVARCDDRLAAAHWELGRLDLAEEHLRSALALWQATDDVEGLARARYRLGSCLIEDLSNEERGVEALELLEKARSVAVEYEVMGLIAACDDKAATVLAHRGDMSRAIMVLRSAASIFDALGDDEQRSLVRTHLASLLARSGSGPEAEGIWRSILEESENASARTRASVAARLARYLSECGRAEEALDVLERFASGLDDDDRTEGPTFEVARAAAYHGLGMHQATIEAADRALDLLDSALLPGIHAAALEYKGRAVLASGQQRDGEALLGQAIALYLIDNDRERAERVAGEILPEPPRRDRARPTPRLSTGLYL